MKIIKIVSLLLLLLTTSCMDEGQQKTYDEGQMFLQSLKTDRSWVCKKEKHPYAYGKCAELLATMPSGGILYRPRDCYLVTCSNGNLGIQLYEDNIVMQFSGIPRSIVDWSHIDLKRNKEDYWKRYSSRHEHQQILDTEKDIIVEVKKIAEVY